MSEKVIVFNDQIEHATFRPDEIEELKKNNIEYIGAVCKTEEDFLKYAIDADIIFDQGQAKITKNVIDNLPRLKAILRRGIGFDNVDVKAAAERGVCVSNTPGFCAEEVSTHAIALFLSFLRKITKYDHLTRMGKWVKSDTKFGYEGMCSPLGEDIGIIGFGNIGRRIFEKLEPYNANFYVYDPYAKIREKNNVKQTGLEELLSKSRYIFLACALTAETENMLNEERFKLLRNDAVIINVGRGKLVDEKILIKYLKENRIEGAALDVFDEEPVSMDNPLLKMDNVVISPHNAGISSKSYDLSFRMSLDEIIRVATGKAPVCRVN